MRPVAEPLGHGAVSTDAVLDVSNLSIEFGHGDNRTFAVNDASLRLGRASIAGIIGESGCGKSTLARAVCRLLPPAAHISEGQIRLATDERDVDLLQLSDKEFRGIRGAEIGFIPQSVGGALNPTLRVGAQFLRVLRTHGLGRSTAERVTIAEDALRMVSLSEPRRVMRSFAAQLSGGMAQRVVIAMTLTLNPGVVVADEPTTSLDVKVQRQLLDSLVELVHSKGLSLLMISHDLGVVARYCQDVHVMYRGFVVESGPTETVLRRPAHPYTAALLASVPQRGRRLQPIPGHVTELKQPADRCPFWERCTVRSDPRCGSEVPELRSVGGTHQVRTFCS